MDLHKYVIKCIVISCEKTGCRLVSKMQQNESWDYYNKVVKYVKNTVGKSS